MTSPSWWLKNFSNPSTPALILMRLVGQVGRGLWVRPIVHRRQGGTDREVCPTRSGRISIVGLTGVSAGSQFLYSVEPIFFRRSGRTASVLPEAISKGGNLVVSECGDAMSNRCRPRMLVRILGVFVGLS